MRCTVRRAQPLTVVSLILSLLLLSPNIAAAKGPGGKILYGTPDALVSAAPDGSNKKILYNADGVVPEPLTVSPDGTKASFLQWVASANHWVMRVVNLSTRSTTTVVPPPALPWSAADDLVAGVWSHDSSKIAVNRSVQGLWTVKPNGKRLTRLIKGGTANYSWSRNDSKIAFNRLKGKTGQGPIYYFDLKTDELHKIGTGYRPRWSPTDDLIAATHYSSGGRVKIFDLNGDVVLKGPVLTGTATADWTPDGAGLIVAMGSLGDDPAEVFYLPADGTDPTTIASLNAGYFLAPMYSPNQKQMAFFACHTRPPCASRDRHVIFMAGIHGEDPIEALARKDFLIPVAWSPRSTALLVCADEGLRYFFKDKLSKVRGVNTCNAGWAK
ncbi:MAG: hypothetical protein JJE05_09510 [Actinobacteria bacterium]|nr:hypothetical protein [Actinomycetota bacterium]